MAATAASPAAPPTANARGPLLTRRQFWELLQISESNFDVRRAAGRISPRPFRVGRGLRWSRAEVEAWLARRDHCGELYDADTWPAVWRKITGRPFCSPAG